MSMRVYKESETVREEYLDLPALASQSRLQLTFAGRLKPLATAVVKSMVARDAGMALVTFGTT